MIIEFKRLDYKVALINMMIPSLGSSSVLIKSRKNIRPPIILDYSYFIYYIHVLYTAKCIQTFIRRSEVHT